MASYRFCRSDDIPALVDAYNRCYLPYDRKAAELSVSGFKDLIRGIDLWTSSCLLARQGDEPIGVLMATKRDDRALIWCIGVHHEHRRQGHARHLLTSLSQKLAILGPPELVAEVPEHLEGAAEFFDAFGWERVATLTDYRRPPRPLGDAKGAELVIATTFDELEANGVLEKGVTRCWSRDLETLGKHRDSLQGLAVASVERIEAWVLFLDSDKERAVQGFGSFRGQGKAVWQELLWRQLASDDRELTISRVHPGENPARTLESRGFKPRANYTVFRGCPIPA